MRVLATGADVVALMATDMVNLGISRDGSWAMLFPRPAEYQPKISSRQPVNRELAEAATRDGRLRKMPETASATGYPGWRDWGYPGEQYEMWGLIS